MENLKVLILNSLLEYFASRHQLHDLLVSHVMPYIPTGVLFCMSVASPSSRRAVFSIWVNAAIDTALHLLPDVLDSLSAHRISTDLRLLRSDVRSQHAADLYAIMRFDVLNGDCKSTASKRILRAMRDVLNRIICAELGFTNRDVFKKHIHVIFCTCREHEPELVAQMLGSFSRDAALANIRNAFLSAAKQKRPRTLNRKQLNCADDDPNNDKVDGSNEAELDVLRQYSIHIHTRDSTTWILLHRTRIQRISMCE